MKFGIRAALLVSAVSILPASIAAAQSQPPPPPPAPYGAPAPAPYGAPAPAAYPPPADPAFAHHRGVMVGIGLGVGIVTCTEDCESESEVAFDFHLGGFLNPRLALMYDVAGVVDSENDLTAVLASNTIAAQYWVSPTSWVKGGLGVSQLRLSGGGGSDSEFGLAATGAAGFEIMQSGGFALDLSGRMSLLRFEDVDPTLVMINAVIGARWK